MAGCPAHKMETFDGVIAVQDAGQGCIFSPQVSKIWEKSNKI